MECHAPFDSIAFLLQGGVDKVIVTEQAEVVVNTVTSSWAGVSIPSPTGRTRNNWVFFGSYEYFSTRGSMDDDNTDSKYFLSKLYVHYTPLFLEDTQCNAIFGYLY